VKGVASARVLRLSRIERTLSTSLPRVAVEVMKHTLKKPPGCRKVVMIGVVNKLNDTANTDNNSQN
jgi:hypothetical protein